MRCLIPMTQERRNLNSLKRAAKLCDSVEILYVVDSSILDRMKRESAYVLNSETLSALESALVKSQREEALHLIKETGMDDHRFHFEVGDFNETVDRYVLRLKPDLIMVDELSRYLLSLNIPVWIDSGSDVRKAVFVVRSIRKIPTLKKQTSFLREICSRFGTEFSIYTEIREESALRTLKSMAPLTENPDGDLIAMQVYDKRHMKKGRNILIFRGRI